VLRIFDPQRETFLQTNASSYAVAGVVSQRDEEDNEIKPIGYYSERLPQTQRHLSSYDLELIAIEKSLKFFRQFLHMRPVTIITDHKNLITPKITENSLLNPARIRRITDVLNQFDFKFQHIKGTQNCLPDLLSRRPEFEKIQTIKAIVEENQLAKMQDRERELYALKIALTTRTFDTSFTPDEISTLQKIDDFISPKTTFYTSKNLTEALAYICPLFQKSYRKN